MEVLSLFAAKQREADADAERALLTVVRAGGGANNPRGEKQPLPSDPPPPQPPGSGADTAGGGGLNAARKKTGAGGLGKASPSGSFSLPSDHEEDQQPDITRKPPKSKSKYCCDVQ